MYSGQLEIRSLPVAGLPSSDGAAGPLALPEELSDLLHAARNDGPRTRPRPPPHHPDERRREASQASRRGSISLAIAVVPFVGQSRKFGGRGAGCGRCSGVVEHLLRDPRWSGCPRPATPARRPATTRRRRRRPGAAAADPAPVRRGRAPRNRRPRPATAAAPAPGRSGRPPWQARTRHRPVGAPSTPAPAPGGPSASPDRPARWWCHRARLERGAQHLDLDVVAVGPAGLPTVPQIGLPDEAGDEHRGGPVVDVGGVPICSTLPWFITAIRSLMVSASSWSWVT